MKVKREGAFKMTVIGMFRTTQHVGSEMPHEDWPKKETHCAIVKYKLPDGSIKTRDTIPFLKCPGWQDTWSSDTQA